MHAVMALRWWLLVAWLLVDLTTADLTNPHSMAERVKAVDIAAGDALVLPFLCAERNRSRADDESRRE